MSGRNKVYYCKQTETPTDNLHRLSPAPVLNISPEIYYANDTIIGYTYNVTLEGYAVSKESTNDLLEGTFDQVEFVRNIFNVNGGNLYVKSDNGTDLIIAKGATIKSISFSESPNYGINYIPYSVTLEFNEIDFPGCNNNQGIPCNSSFFHLNQTSKNITSDNLVDFKKYKIKDFTDSWNVQVGPEIYNQYATTNTEESFFSVQYQIQATGKNYYISDKLIPAWHQARNFCQDRLYEQVKGLVTGIGRLGANETANDLYQVVEGEGLLEGFSPGTNVNIYNETIQTTTSEADGTFTVTYSAIIKKGPSDANSLAKHQFTTSYNVTNNSGLKEVSITISGTVEGLIKGGFLYHNTRFTLPQSGTFLTSVPSSNNTKYQQAWDYYYSKVGGKGDINSVFKNLAGVNRASLNAYSQNSGSNITPQSFSLDHDYVTGSINYNATYTTQHTNRLDLGYENITITKKGSTKVFAEFVVPGRGQGPIIQDVGLLNPATVSISIEGVGTPPDCNFSNICNKYPAFTSLINNYHNDPGGYSNLQTNYVVTTKSYNVSALDGSYSATYEIQYYN